MELEERQGIFGSCKFFPAQVPTPPTSSLCWINFFGGERKYKYGQSINEKVRLVQARGNDGSDHVSKGIVYFKW